MLDRNRIKREIQSKLLIPSTQHTLSRKTHAHVAFCVEVEPRAGFEPATYASSADATKASLLATYLPS